MKSDDYHAQVCLRKWRRRFHLEFDTMWVEAAEKLGWSKHRARAAAYRWLAYKLGLNEMDCHASQFNIEQCSRAIHFCKAAKRSV
jgi:zinc-finger-containing domain